MAKRKTWKKGKTFTAKKGKLKGRKVAWHYPNGSKKGKKLRRV